MPQLATISLEEDPSEPDLEILHIGLSAHNRARVGMSGYAKLTLFLRDEAGAVIGGLEGETSRGWLYVDLLWVSEAFRGLRYGTRLLQAAEDEAVRRGCHGVYLDTYGFQAPFFYQARGYRIFGELPDFPIGYSLYFLTKPLGTLEDSSVTAQ